MRKRRNYWGRRNNGPLEEAQFRNNRWVYIRRPWLIKEDTVNPEVTCIKCSGPCRLINTKVVQGELLKFVSRCDNCKRTHTNLINSEDAFHNLIERAGH